MPKHKKNLYPDFSDEKKLLYLKNGHINEKTLSKIETVERSMMEVLEKVASGLSPQSDYSIYTGYSGIALTFLLKYNQTSDERILFEAIKLVDNAVSVLKKKRISFLNGDAGPLALAAVLHKINHEEKLADELIARLLKLDFENPSHPDEVLYGRAGYLSGLLFLDKHLNSKVVPIQHYRKVIQSILQSGRKLAKEVKSSSPLYYMWHDKNYLGAAHGVAGILYLLLTKEDLLTDEEKMHVKGTLQWLERERFPSGNPKSSEGSDRDRLVQWCHGAPGFVHLYLTAYKVYGDKKYLGLAEEMGEIVWERGIPEKGYSICHGVAGNAYTFLALYQVTKDEKQLYRAACFADYCTTHPEHQGMEPDRPYSLYEGIAGVAYFLNDVKGPLNSSFPAYEL